MLKQSYFVAKDKLLLSLVISLILTLLMKCVEVLVIYPLILGEVSIDPLFNGWFWLYSLRYFLPFALYCLLAAMRRFTYRRIYSLSIFAYICIKLINNYDSFKGDIERFGFVIGIVWWFQRSSKYVLPGLLLFIVTLVILDKLTRKLFRESEISPLQQPTSPQAFKRQPLEETPRAPIEEERDPLATTFPFSYLTGEAALSYTEEGRPERIGLLLQETGHYEISLDTFGKARHVKKHETTRANANERVVLVFEQMGIVPEAGSELVIKKQGLSGEERIPL